MKKKIVMTVALLVALTGIAAQAWAACPPGTSYQCHQGWNGKVICGCQ